jgi:hypothetical protein
MADYDISKAFETIENELIDSMMRNFKHHRAEEEKEGYNWSQWQSEQLKSLEQYRRTNQKKYGKQFSALNKKIEEMLKTAMADGNAKQEAEILKAIKKGFNVGKVSPSATGEFFKVNDRKLDALINATKSDMEKAETAILRMSNDKYRKAIFNTQVYANSGAGTYEKAVDMAVKDMLQAGLNCVEYRNGARHTLSDYADMAIRTANKRAYLYGEGQKRQEWGISLVVVNSRQGGCPDCAQYIGRVFIDDVYSGGSKADGNYPLLSEAIAGGLFHPRCKDSTSTYYKGITSLEPVSSEELAKMEERETLETKQQNAERQEKRYNRLAQHSLDEDNKIKYQNRADDWHTSNEEYKEKLDEIIENSSESGIINNKDLIGTNVFSISAKQKLLEDERKIAENEFETAIIYDAVGNRKYLKKGKVDEVTFSDEEIKQMKGCVLTHNHPSGTVFSPEDINILRRGKLTEIRACNGRGSYVLRNSDEWNEKLKDLETIESEYWNCMGIAGEKYVDIAAQEGKPIYAYLKEMDEAGLELFSKQYNLEFSWEDKI